MAVSTSNDQEFTNAISQNPKVVVKYYADWCGSCKLIAPKFTKLSNEEQFQDVTFLEINAETNPEARKIAGVTNLPFFATFKDGTLVEADFTAKIEGVSEMINRSFN